MLASSTQLLRVKKRAKKEEKKREKVTNKNERKRGAHQNSLPEIEAKLERRCLGVKYNFLKALKFLFFVCLCLSE